MGDGARHELVAMTQPLQARRRILRWTMLAAAGLAAVLSGCAPTSPIELPTQYQAPSDADDPVAVDPHATACLVRLDDVHDLRSDPETMGSVFTMVKAKDSRQWVLNGLRSMGIDKRLRLLDRPQPDGGELLVSTELVKAYIMAQNTQKAANIVLRVRYSRGGVALSEHVYRGAVTNIDWAGGVGETVASLNEALYRDVAQIHDDILKLCPAAPIAR